MEPTFAIGDYVTINAQGMYQLDGRVFQVSATSANTFADENSAVLEMLTAELIAAAELAFPVTYTFENIWDIRSLTKGLDVN